MTANREKLREDVARAIWGDHAKICEWQLDIAASVYALIRPAVLREAAEVGERLIENAYNAGFCEGMREHTSRNGGIPWCDSVAKKKGATAILALSLLSPDAEKEADWFTKQDFYKLEYKGACPVCGCEEVDHRNLWTCRCPAPRSPDVEKEEGR